MKTIVLDLMLMSAGAQSNAKYLNLATQFKFCCPGPGDVCVATVIANQPSTELVTGKLQQACVFHPLAVYESWT